MKISARNILKGTVEKVADGAVNGVVTIKVGNDTVKADITMEAIKDLGLESGKEAFAIIKARSVMFAAGSERITTISARNQLPGTVVAVNKGAVNGHVTIKTESGNTIKGSITTDQVQSFHQRTNRFCHVPAKNP